MRSKAAPLITLKGLTLWQPWATLVAIGAKRVETRSWPCPHPGPLVIHAAKTTPADVLWQAEMVPAVREALAEAGIGFDELPSGKLLAVARRVRSMPAWMALSNGLISERERALGDYSEKRYAWFLDEIIPLPKPISCSGRQGLWPVAEPLWQDMEGLWGV